MYALILIDTVRYLVNSETMVVVAVPILASTEAEVSVAWKKHDEALRQISAREISHKNPSYRSLSNDVGNYCCGLRVPLLAVDGCCHTLC